MALSVFAEHDFRKPPGRGMVRAHITPRNQTARELMEMAAPLAEAEFFRFWLERDRTVLVAKGENTDPLPDYIPFTAPAGLFSSAQLVGWRHGRAEREFLRELALQHR